MPGVNITELVGPELMFHVLHSSHLYLEVTTFSRLTYNFFRHDPSCLVLELRIRKLLKYQGKQDAV